MSLTGDHLVYDPSVDDKCHDRYKLFLLGDGVISIADRGAYEQPFILSNDSSSDMCSYLAAPALPRRRALE